MDWRPIESVPTHTSVILCFRWRKPGWQGKPFVAEGYLDWDKKRWCLQSGDSPGDDIDPPTEWMPMPSPPKP